MSALLPHPTRVLVLEGATNFRDLGGYVGADQRPVRWGQLFRSEHLADLSPSDLQHLAQLGVRRSFDFRGREESAAEAYAWPQIERHALPIEPTVVQRLQAHAAVAPLSAADAVLAMQDTYRDFVRNNSPRFAELFDHLLNADSPLVFHCTAGKDRTGLAAVLILSALGVTMTDIEADYLLSNAHYQRRQKPLPDAHVPRLPPEVMQVVWQVQAEFLASALDVIQADHGGLGPYLTQQMGLSAAALKQLRALYLVA